jgi:Putative metallopeptidase
MAFDPGTIDVIGTAFRVDVVMSFRNRAFAVAWLFLGAMATTPVLAQGPVLRGVTGVQVEYKEPINPAHRPIYERLKKREVLEQYKQFMSPLKLTRALNVSLQGCNGVINAVHQAGRITYCYELIADMHRQIAEANVLPGFRREDAVVGGFVSTLLHETGHAIFYLLDIPIFGREEDAADAIASYVALQFGPTAARRILTGTAFVWRASEMLKQGRSGRRFEDYSDEHGTDAQRFYNTVCVALGSDFIERNNTFADFAPLLPDTRRSQCPREYLHVKNSFARFVLPHVDVPLMQKVRATQWLRSEDGSEIAPPQPFGPRSSPGSASSGPGSFGPSSPGPLAPTPAGAGPPRPR